MTPNVPFHSLYQQGFCRVAVCTPEVVVADPDRNAASIVALAREASAKHAILAVFPELGVSAYTNDDLFFQDALLEAVETALRAIVAESVSLEPVLVVGAPWRAEGKLFNCAFVVHRGRVAGVVPKSYLPNYREFYEKRQFSAALHARIDVVRLFEQEVPFGANLVFDASALPGFSLHVEICEDLWVPIPPSTWGALAGATVLVNLSASNASVGKAAYRRLLCASQSARCISAYLYSAAGSGESTTDLAWDGHGLIYENGQLLAETERYRPRPGLVLADVDLDRLRQDRIRMTSLNDCAASWRDQVSSMRRVPLAVSPPQVGVTLSRPIARFPFVPDDPLTRDERCAEVYAIQVQGLAQRLQATGIRRAVIGISGGLDSSHALVVTAKCFDRLGWPRSDILGFSMPGFATSERTRGNAHRLMQALGVSAGEIDIRPSALQMLRDLGHPYSRGEPLFDVTFENVQAGERASHLFRLANQHRGIVVGTSDLSELALGYTTYGVGDHMAHYHVNASVPKTLIQHLVHWVIATRQLTADACDVLSEIVETDISPELVPADEPGRLHRAEETIGPYALQDFNLYYLSRFGYRPSKVAYLALHAWGDKDRGSWPETLQVADRAAYDLPSIVKWLEVFIVRFFETSQFKRSAMPNAPKIGSGGSLSPRGDWRAPSDASAAAWLTELHSALGGELGAR
jgi:NAD+ synthase (glutamine-hydrolysing)